MGVQVGLGHSSVFSVASLCPCSRPPPFLKHFELSFASTKLNIRLISVGSHGIYGIPVRILPRRRTIMAVAKAEPDRLDEGDVEEEVGESCGFLEKEDLRLEEKHNASQLKSRVISGLAIGFSVGGTILVGGWIFTISVAAAAFIAAREYFGLVRSDGIAVGMTPPPRYVSRVCSVICALMPLWTLYAGHIDISVTSAAFIALTERKSSLCSAEQCHVRIVLLWLSTLFLGQASMWSITSSPKHKYSSSLNAECTAPLELILVGSFPLNMHEESTRTNRLKEREIGQFWPVLLGGPTHWTVGLVATLLSISSIIAADTYAFLGGKAFGRTPLINVSPKKTWEGALAGLAGCVATSVVLSKLLYWPKSLPSAVALGFLNFFGSLFGDLTESMIKRDAGVKDSGSLIPGHGGILDRTDSYIFTGALVHSFVRTFLPLFGV